MSVYHDDILFLKCNNKICSIMKCNISIYMYYVLTKNNEVFYFDSLNDGGCLVNHMYGPNIKIFEEQLGCAIDYDNYLWMLENNVLYKLNIQVLKEYIPQKLVNSARNV